VHRRILLSAVTIGIGLALAVVAAEGIRRLAGYPNGAMHTRWADCIDTALRLRFAAATRNGTP
jgi:hypothetical protein